MKKLKCKFDSCCEEYTWEIGKQIRNKKMQNTTNEKRYSVELVLDEYRGYLGVPVYLYKGGFMNVEDLRKITNDLDEINDENEMLHPRLTAQYLFSAKEINELKAYFGSKKGVKLVTDEIPLPIKLKGIVSYEEIAGGTYKDPLVDVFIYRDEYNILSFELKGYSDLEVRNALTLEVS